MSSRTRKILVLPLIVALAIFSGCGGGGSSPSDSSADSGIPAKTLSWEPPTSYVDTTPMNPVTDLDRFEIHVNETGAFTDKDVPMAELAAVDVKTQALVTSFNLANIGSLLTVGPKYYVSLRAVAHTGLKSEYSPPVSFSF